MNTAGRGKIGLNPSTENCDPRNGKRIAIEVLRTICGSTSRASALISGWLKRLNKTSPSAPASASSFALAKSKKPKTRFGD
jgi:hypothetical protein